MMREYFKGVVKVLFIKLTKKNLDIIKFYHEYSGIICLEILFNFIPIKLLNFNQNSEFMIIFIF